MLVARRPRMTQAMAERLLRKPLYLAGAMLAAGTRTPWWPAPPTRRRASSRPG
jgi:hypothetical protein